MNINSNTKLEQPDDQIHIKRLKQFCIFNKITSNKEEDKQEHK